MIAYDKIVKEENDVDEDDDEDNRIEWNWIFDSRQCHLNELCFYFVVFAVAGSGCDTWVGDVWRIIAAPIVDIEFGRME